MQTLRKLEFVQDVKPGDIINFIPVNTPNESRPFKIYQTGECFLVDQNRLRDALIGFWAADCWNMQINPTGVIPPSKNRYKHIIFNCQKSEINTELKYVAYLKFVTKAWSPTSANCSGQIHRLIRFFNAINPKVRSILDFSLKKWELLLSSYLHETKQWQPLKLKKLNINQVLNTRDRVDRCVEVLRVIYRELEDIYDTRPEEEKDVWNVRKLGVAVNESRSESTLNFIGVEPAWLRNALKKHLYVFVFKQSRAYCAVKIAAVKKFGLFLSKMYPLLASEGINRKLLLEYVSWICRTELTPNLRYSYLVTLRTFLENAARENYLPLPEKRILFEDDFPARVKHKPRFISEFVMEQLERLLPQISNEQLRRMCIVLIEGGMRISELCSIKLSCLSQDGEGDYFLLYYQSKLKKEHTIPLSKQTADAIIEQQKYVKTSGNKTEFLFPRSNGYSYKSGTFNKKLNEFAYEHKIADESGKLWRFQAHQLRHTAATRMINAGVAQHIVQKFMGHESPEMTARYAFIHDQTLKKEFQTYREQRGDLIDITGNVIKREQPTEADNADLQWFKKNIQAQALPNGFCGLPAVQTACPHANACLSCASFRTDASFLPQHKEQLQKTQQLVQISRTNGWARQTEMNEKLTKNLETIINKLEINPEKVTQETSEENN